MPSDAECRRARKGANISGGVGRSKGRDRKRPLEIARGGIGESLRNPGANFRTGRIEPKECWPIHNLLMVIVKMLNSLLVR